MLVTDTSTHLCGTCCIPGTSPALIIWPYILTACGCSGDGRHCRPQVTAEEGGTMRQSLCPSLQRIHAGPAFEPHGLGVWALEGLPMGWETKQGQGVSQGWGQGERKKKRAPISYRTNQTPSAWAHLGGYAGRGVARAGRV